MIGTFPGAGYYLHHSAGTREFFAGLLEWANVKQRILSNDSDVKARLHEGPGGKYLWVVNPTRTSREVTIQLSASDEELSIGKDLWGGMPVTAGRNAVKVTVGERDAAVISLQ